MRPISITPLFFYRIYIIQIHWNQKEWTIFIKFIPINIHSFPFFIDITLSIICNTLPLILTNSFFYVLLLPLSLFSFFPFPSVHVGTVLLFTVTAAESSFCSLVITVTIVVPIKFTTTIKTFLLENKVGGQWAMHTQVILFYHTLCLSSFPLFINNLSFITTSSLWIIFRASLQSFMHCYF